MGFGRLRCMPRRIASGEYSCCIALCMDDNLEAMTSWEPIWWHCGSGSWSLPAPGSSRYSASVLARERGPSSLLKCVIGSTHSATAWGGSAGYDAWLTRMLALPERIVPILFWDWESEPSCIQTLQAVPDRQRGPRGKPRPLICDSQTTVFVLPFPPGFFGGGRPSIIEGSDLAAAPDAAHAPSCDDAMGGSATHVGDQVAPPGADANVRRSDDVLRESVADVSALQEKLVAATEAQAVTQEELATARLTIDQQQAALVNLQAILAADHATLVEAHLALVSSGSLRAAAAVSAALAQRADENVAA